MKTYELNPIGTIYNGESGTFLQLTPEFIPALQALDGFSHINILWWFSDFDTAEFRSELETEEPYKNSPEVMGVFATRSPVRPNPIALSTAEMIRIDYLKGIIQIA